MDTPIRNPEEDVLGRAKLAESFSEQLLSLDASEGLVTGALGPWGSGKTSFVNLVRPHLKKAGIEILDFNPWMFSGTEQLVESFFVELSAQLRGRDRRRFYELGKSLTRYGEIFSGMRWGWLPVAGPWIDRVRLAMKLLVNLPDLRKEGIAERRDKVKKALTALGTPLVVVVDDIDRLTTPEIRAVFKLVRLTANFPNVIYITAFDRERVEKALTESTGIRGRDYLEKILQWDIDLPEIPEEVLIGQITQAIDGALSGIENAGPFDEERWPDVFHDVVRPLLRNNQARSSLCHCNSRYCASPQRPSQPCGCSRLRSHSHVSPGCVFCLAQIDTQPHHDLDQECTRRSIVPRKSDQRTDRDGGTGRTKGSPDNSSSTCSPQPSSMLAASTTALILKPSGFRRDAWRMKIICVCTWNESPIKVPRHLPQRNKHGAIWRTAKPSTITCESCPLTDARMSLPALKCTRISSARSTSDQEASYSSISCPSCLISGEGFSTSNLATPSAE